MKRLSILIVLLGLAAVGAVGYHHYLSSPSPSDSQARQDAAAARALFAGAREFDAQLQRLQATASALGCPEDAIVLWTGEGHNYCLPLDDLICGPGQTCAQAVREALERAGVLISELGSATSVEPPLAQPDPTATPEPPTSEEH